jgi:hypothetical protein
MLPKLPILARASYKSGFLGAQYDPRTLITRVTEPNIIELERSSDFAQMFEYNATRVHEMVHWFQHHGTSFGCFLESLRLSQFLTTLRYLRSMPSDKAKDLIHKRNKFSRPILEIDPQTQYPIFHEGENNNEMNLFKQIWFDHQWVHTVLEDSRILQSGLRQIPGVSFGEVISDVMLALREDSDFLFDAKNVSAILESREWFSIPDHEMQFTDWRGKALTSKALMESAATISEIQLFRYSAHFWSVFIEEEDRIKIIKSRVDRILEGDYGLPIRIILEIMQIDFSSDINLLFDMLPTVNILCFIALNPPLPPYVMSPPCDRQSWQWNDLYPPVRFIRLARCIKKIGLLNDWRNHESISSYIYEVSTLCQLPHTIDFSIPKI